MKNPTRNDWLEEMFSKEISPNHPKLGLVAVGSLMWLAFISIFSFVDQTSFLQSLVNAGLLMHLQFLGMMVFGVFLMSLLECYVQEVRARSHDGQTSVRTSKLNRAILWVFRRKFVSNHGNLCLSLLGLSMWCSSVILPSLPNWHGLKAAFIEFPLIDHLKFSAVMFLGFLFLGVVKQHQEAIGNHPPGDSGLHPNDRKPFPGKSVTRLGHRIFSDHYRIWCGLVVVAFWIVTTLIEGNRNGQDSIATPFASQLLEHLQFLGILLASQLGLSWAECVFLQQSTPAKAKIEE